MTDVVQFPGAPSDRTLRDDRDQRHTKAFRDLEGPISDCVNMALIGAQMILSVSDDVEGELIFAVNHTFDMLTKLKADYYAAYHGERDIEL
jgi:hypothetical protein